MKIAIIGSRTLTKNLYIDFYNKIMRMHSVFNTIETWDDGPFSTVYSLAFFGKSIKDIEFISGGAINGGDDFARFFIKQINNEFIKPYFGKELKLKEYKPDYIKFKGNEKLAPLDRNTTIAKEADMIIAIWDGESRGTLDVIRKARKMKKDTLIMYF